MKKGVIIPNNAGLVVTTLLSVPGDLVHTLSTGRSAYLRKIMWSNNTGFLGFIIFGTTDNAAVPTFIPLLPAFTCLNGFDIEMPEEDIPDVIWRINRAALAGAGWTGNIMVQATVPGILIACSVEEVG